MTSTGQLLYSSDIFLPATLLHFSLHAKLIWCKIPQSSYSISGPLLVSYSTTEASKTWHSAATDIIGLLSSSAVSGHLLYTTGLSGHLLYTSDL